MRRSVIGISTFAAALVLAAAPLNAQLYVGGYATLPSGDFGDFAKTGWMAEGGVKVFSGSNDRLELYVSGAYGKNTGKADLGFDVDYTSLVGLGHVVFDLTEGANATPYLIGSAGYWSLKEDATNLGKETNGGFAWGGGAGIGFAKRFYVEGRYLTAKISDATTSMILVGAGVSF